jgi:hypothetical protein
LQLSLEMLFSGSYTTNPTPPETPDAKREIAMFSNWKGWHWVLVGLGAAVAAEKALETEPSLAPFMGPALYVTTAALTLVGMLSPSVSGTK